MTNARVFSFVPMMIAVFCVDDVSAIVPQHHIVDGFVQIEGVDGSNPIIYDNDWWFDVFDNNYLWAQASLGNADLVGNVVTRDMWDWDKGYHYAMQRCRDDAEKALRIARESGLRNIPDLTVGSDGVLRPPKSNRIEDTVPDPSEGSQLIIREARKASPEKPLVIVAGGPLTTVANALLIEPDIAPNIVVFGLTVSYYGYNGKDGWSAYIVAKRARLVEWATRDFWKRGSVFRPEHFSDLPDNPFCNEMKELIRTDLGMANQLGDGAPLVWLFEPKCWTKARTRKAVWKGKALELPLADAGDVLDMPRSGTDLEHCRREFFRVLTNRGVYHSEKHTCSTSTATWPLRVRVEHDIVPGVSKAWLEDQDGEPFLYSADTCWFLCFNASDDEVAMYLDDCVTRNITAVQTMFIPWTRAGEDAWKGEKPFIDGDFTRRNDAYWRHVDFVMRAAYKRGVAMVCAVAWKGCCGEGWDKVLAQQSEENLRDYGRFLGERYGKRFPNVQVFLGGDSSGLNQQYSWIAEGLKEASPGTLIASHPASYRDRHSPMSSTMPGEYPHADFLDVSWVYTYRPGHNKRDYVHVYRAFHLEWDRNQSAPTAVSKPRPAILGESTYIGHAGGGDWRVRRAMHWAILGGGAGHAHGNDPIWHLGEGWKAALDDPSRRCLTAFYKIYSKRPWWKLVPESKVDGALPFITSGRGTYDTDRHHDETKSENFVVAAITPDRDLAMAYLTKHHPGEIYVDLSLLSRAVTVTWADPTNGTEIAVNGSPFPNRGEHHFVRPGRNSYGDRDWLLILEVSIGCP